MSSPKHQDSQKNIQFLIQWIYKEAVKIFTVWRQVKRQMAEKGFPVGKQKHPPNSLTMEITGKSSF